MNANEKEYSAVLAAIDFIECQSDGADEDKYPHDIIDGLSTLFHKIKKDRANRRFRYLVKKELKKIKK